MTPLPDAYPGYDVHVDPRTWTIIRLDGHRFTAGSAAYRPPIEVIARSGIIAPFSPAFHEAMRAATNAVAEVLPVSFAHTASDEISIIIAPNDAGFCAGRLDKWMSLGAGTASASLAQNLGRFIGLPVMDARALRADSLAAVEAYLRDRISSSWRNCRNAYVWHALATKGLDPTAIEATASALTKTERDAVLATTPHPPAWARLGAFLTWESDVRSGRDPRTGVSATSTRRQPSWVEIERLDTDLRPILESRRRRG